MLELAKTLLDFGGRVQFSVFEARLDRELLEKLVDRLEKIVDKSEDSVKIYPLCGSCEAGVRMIGQERRLREEDVYIL
ncbi:CRISPR-associated endonuclease Cas2 [Candidatus Electronema sp. JC]|uniref:CRISPR-associated endonuclease Cas2 n=1 Tax=Candidatus Electronema sp. JC TaxID=3401570 RepID=UPI003B43B4BF